MRMVVHGGIDGYSCLITFLQCHTDNKADSVLSAFANGMQKYGMPRKVRSDHGGENIEVWRAMISEHSSDKCVITGSSTHNERIERLWRDVHRSVIVTFANAFRQLEDDKQLDPLNEVDIYCLHSTYVPHIQQSLDAFGEAWNNHAISTECNATPEQLFLTSLLESPQVESDSESSDTDYNTIASNEAVPVPQCSFQPCNQLQGNIRETLQNCPDDAKLQYLAQINVCGQHLRTYCNDCNEQ